MDNAIGYLILCNAWFHLLASIEVNGHGEAMDILSAAKMRTIDAGIPREQFALTQAILQRTNPFLTHEEAVSK